MISPTLPSPTKQQCDQWEISLNRTLEDPQGFTCFYVFLKSYEEEKDEVNEGQFTRYLDFWSECQTFKTKSFNSFSDARDSANEIFNRYLNTRAEKKIDLGGYDHIVPKTREKLQADIHEFDEDISTLLTIFDESLSGMRQYLNEGGCGGAYYKWKSQLRPKEKKNKRSSSCRLL